MGQRNAGDALAAFTGKRPAGVPAGGCASRSEQGALLLPPGGAAEFDGGARGTCPARGTHSTRSKTLTRLPTGLISLLPSAENSTFPAVCTVPHRFWKRKSKLMAAPQARLTARLGQGPGRGRVRLGWQRCKVAGRAERRGRELQVGVLTP